jgi:hypothetical protein
MPRGSAMSRATVKDDDGSEGLLKGLDDKPQIEFVNETVETISPACIGYFVPKDESGLKRKRGTPKKGCSESPEAPSAVPKDEPRGTREGGQTGFAI